MDAIRWKILKFCFNWKRKLRGSLRFHNLLKVHWDDRKIKYLYILILSSCWLTILYNVCVMCMVGWNGWFEFLRENEWMTVWMDEIWYTTYTCKWIYKLIAFLRIKRNYYEQSTLKTSIFYLNIYIWDYNELNFWVYFIFIKKFGPI